MDIIILTLRVIIFLIGFQYSRDYWTTFNSIRKGVKNDEF